MQKFSLRREDKESRAHNIFLGNIIKYMQKVAFYSYADKRWSQDPLDFISPFFHSYITCFRLLCSLFIYVAFLLHISSLNSLIIMVNFFGEKKEALLSFALTYSLAHNLKDFNFNFMIWKITLGQKRKIFSSLSRLLATK